MTLHNENNVTKEEIYFENGKITDEESEGYLGTSTIKNELKEATAYSMTSELIPDHVNIEIGKTSTITFVNLDSPIVQGVIFNQVQIMSENFVMAPGSLLIIENDNTDQKK